ncbi:aldo/keto reductase [Prauserella flavalba]|uniref:Aldo/keto reductase n=1 Tax=Prauserella flavalba TaxID=1477506 RepID=A0A318MF90_9PSEU|nr:aldo/keto reductase [Prauserella flavalba]PXY37760.1 aldo/keto reductase [Prauserella flavalba]
MTSTTTSTWQLGDHLVNRLGFGAMRLASPADRSAREHAITVLRRAVELGVNHIDTASFYAANGLIAEALRPYPDDLLIAVKVGPNAELTGEAPPGELRAQVERNLRELRRDHFDLVYLRIGGGLERGRGSLTDRFAVLAELREEGLIRHLGISNVGIEHLAEAQAIAPVVAVQNWYGLAKRDDDRLLDLCAEQNVAFVPFFSVQGGAPDARVAEIARTHGATPAQILLAWSLHRSPNVLAIPGTGDPAHLEQNVAAAGLRLSEHELLTLNSIE